MGTGMGIASLFRTALWAELQKDMLTARRPYRAGC